MKAKIEKGSDEWYFFRDFYQFREEWHDPEDAHEHPEFLDDVIHAAGELVKKYSKTAGAKFYEDMIYAHLDDLDRRAHKSREELAV